MFFLILFKTYFTNITRQEAVNTKYNGSLQFSFIKPAYKSNTRKIISVIQRCSVKKVFLEISQNSQENTCARVSFLIKLQARWL